MTGSAAPGRGAVRSAAAELAAPSARAGPVGVVVALPAEARCIVSARFPFGHSCSVGTDMLLCLGGIGAQGGEMASRTLVDAGAAALVSWGVAAGLDPTMASGTLILSDRVATLSHSDDSASTPARRESRAWLDRLVARLSPRITVARGPIAVADHVLRTVGDRRALAGSGASAADMESGAVAAVANAAGIPWIAMRAIADAAGDTVPEAVLTSVDRSGKVRAHRLAAGLIRHPADLFRLPRLARGFDAARRTLRAVALHAGPALLAPRTTGHAGDVGDARR
jgi:adenosylhomocysteine nucleosidase